MTLISRDQDVVTLISVFTVTSKDQQRLVDLLVEATEEVISKQPGYVSANIHSSLDSTQVTNYAQWRGREALEAIFRNPDATLHVREAEKLAIAYEPHLYEVAFTHVIA
ncbi:MAG: antibiotic biosynthesis monooxygenase [Rubrobacter sp.]|nr:antibiotic biosynthesis monooxygenase [Rubrobacter sp.]